MSFHKISDYKVTVSFLIAFLGFFKESAIVEVVHNCNAAFIIITGRRGRFVCSLFSLLVSGGFTSFREERKTEVQLLKVILWGSCLIVSVVVFVFFRREPDHK